MNKEEERRYLDVLLELCPYLGVKDILNADPPDFIASTDEGSLGIEVTRFFFPSESGMPPQAIHAYRQSLILDLQASHEATDIPNLRVSVRLFADRVLQSSDKRLRLKNALFQFVRDSGSWLDGRREFDWEEVSTELSELGVQSLSVLKDQSLLRPIWSFPYASFVPDSAPGLIQEIVTKKSSSANAYSDKFDRLWLLIVSGGHGLHSDIQLKHGVLSAFYDSLFDRIFVLRLFGNVVHELKIA